MKGGDQFITSIQNVVMNVLGASVVLSYHKNNKLCHICYHNVIGNEEHFVLECPSNAPFTSPLERVLLPCMEN